jgi:uncharacterized protein (DUF2141 family)
MRALVLALTLAAMPALAWAAQPAQMATLTVKVDGVSDKGGNLRLGVYNQAQFAVRGIKPVVGAIVPAKAGEMVLTFKLPPGEYGVKTFQDENRNGVLDTYFGMIPSEPFGISNDAQHGMAPATWDDAKFAVKPGANAIVIHLH